MPKTRADAMSLNAIMGDRDGARGDHSVVAFAPPSTVQCCRSATWSAVEIETTEVLRHEPFAYEFTAPRHLLIASATDRYDGETRVDGLPGSHLRAWNRKMTFCSRRMPVLRLAETACVVSRRSPLYRPTQLAAANRPSLRRNPISPAVVVFRPRSLGYHCQAQGAGGEFRSKADRLCRSAQHRFGLRAHARERERLACGDAKSRRASGMAAEEADAIHRRTPCRGRLLVVFGRAGTAEPVPFFPHVQAIV